MTVMQADMYLPNAAAMQERSEQQRHKLETTGAV